MLMTFIVLYLLVSLGIGLYAAKRVKNTADYAVAGRSLPLAVVIAGANGLPATGIAWARWWKTRLARPCAWCWWDCSLPIACTSAT